MNRQLLQIIFHQSVDSMVGSPGNGFWWDLSKDFVLPILLAGFAGYMVYFVFVKETKRDKEKEQKKKDEEQFDKLRYFSALVESALRASVEQKDNLEKHILAMGQNNLDFQLMSYVPLYDFKRISEELNLEEYLLAYTNHYDKDRAASIKEFKNIIASIDYLYDVFISIKSQLEKSQANDYERKKTFQQLYQQSYDLIGGLMLYFGGNDKQSFNEVTLLLQNLQQNNRGNNDDLNYHYKFFIEPFNNFCIQYSMSGRQLLPQILQLAAYTRDGKQVFFDIQKHNDDLKNDLNEDFKAVCQCLNEFQATSQQMLKEFHAIK